MATESFNTAFFSGLLGNSSSLSSSLSAHQKKSLSLSTSQYSFKASDSLERENKEFINARVSNSIANKNSRLRKHLDSFIYLTVLVNNGESFTIIASKTMTIQQLAIQIEAGIAFK